MYAILDSKYSGLDGQRLRNIKTFACLTSTQRLRPQVLTYKLSIHSHIYLSLTHAPKCYDSLVEESQTQSY